MWYMEERKIGRIAYQPPRPLKPLPLEEAPLLLPLWPPRPSPIPASKEAYTQWAVLTILLAFDPFKLVTIIPAYSLLTNGAVRDARRFFRFLGGRSGDS